MALRDILLNLFKNLLIEGPAAKIGLTGLIPKLEVSGQEINTRLGGIANSASNRKQLRHIIGIERWGQSRLRTLQGQPLLQDEYDGYQPAETVDWNDLRDQFASTRAATLALVRQLTQAGLIETATAKHNSFGDLTLRGWVNYLVAHANRESKLIC